MAWKCSIMYVCIVYNVNEFVFRNIVYLFPDIQYNVLSIKIWFWFCILVGICRSAVMLLFFICYLHCPQPVPLCLKVWLVEMPYGIKSAFCTISFSVFQLSLNKWIIRFFFAGDIPIFSYRLNHCFLQNSYHTSGVSGDSGGCGNLCHFSMY
jgi:hypothetical protein